MAQRAATYGVGLAVVMALFAYGDLQESSFVANVMAHGHWDLYRYFQAVPDLRSVPTAMPPLYYASTAVWLWLLCPTESFVQGQFDTIPAAITAWGLLVYDQERPWRALLLLGMRPPSTTTRRC